MKGNIQKKMKRALTVIIFLAVTALMLFSLTSCTEATVDSTDSINAYKNCVSQNPDGKFVLVAFPGLGIKAYIIPQIAFVIPLGGERAITVYWSTVIILAAIAAGIAYSVVMSKKKGIKNDDIFDIFIWGIVGGIIGGRLYYVLCVPSQLSGNFLNIFNIGMGMAFYGSLIGGLLAAFIVCKVKKISFTKTLDTFIPGVMLAQIIGRWADFISGSSYGYEIGEGSSLYWLRMAVYPHLGSENGIAASKNKLAFVQPTFLYESLWLLIGFIALNCVYLRIKKGKDGKNTLSFNGRLEGQLLFIYLIWYGFGRLFTELIRTDSLCIPGTTIRLSLLLSCIFMLAGIALIVRGLIMTKKAELARQSYDTNFPLFRPDHGKTEKSEDSEGKGDGDDNN